MDHARMIAAVAALVTAIAPLRAKSVLGAEGVVASGDLRPKMQ
jgi:hypothetical protein